MVIQLQIVSRVHARIERSDLRYTLHDTGSSNKTYVNYSQIEQPYLLKDNDVIGLGAQTPMLRFLDPDPTARISDRLQYDERAMQFRIDHQPIELPKMQFKLLAHLYLHPGEVCTRESCAQAMWGNDYHPGRDAAALDRAINNLRARLREIDPDTRWIETRRGLGYILKLH